MSGDREQELRRRKIGSDTSPSDQTVSTAISESTVTLSCDASQHLGITLTEELVLSPGVLIEAVHPSDVAAAVGLRAGQVITKAGGKPAKVPEDVLSTLESSRTGPVEVQFLSRVDAESARETALPEMKAKSARDQKRYIFTVLITAVVGIYIGMRYCENVWFESQAKARGEKTEFSEEELAMSKTMSELAKNRKAVHISELDEDTRAELGYTAENAHEWESKPKSVDGTGTRSTPKIAGSLGSEAAKKEKSDLLALLENRPAVDGLDEELPPLESMSAEELEKMTKQVDSILEDFKDQPLLKLTASKIKQMDDPRRALEMLRVFMHHAGSMKGVMSKMQEQDSNLYDKMAERFGHPEVEQMQS